MKKFFAMLLTLALVLSLAACGGGSGGSGDSGSGSGDSSQAPADSGSGSGDSSQAPADSGSSSGDKVVRIGVFEPATGDSGAGGKQEMLGMQYGNKETPTVEIGGETYNVELVYADNASSADKAPTAASQLVSQDVSLVLGTYGSSSAIAGGPIFGEAGLAAIGVTCTNPGVTAGNDYYFRICFLDPFQGTVLANFASEKFSAKKAYLLGELGNDYDQGLLNYFKQAFETVGGQCVVDSFPTNTSDFSTYLNKAVAEGADVIFCPVSIAYSTQIVKLAASMGLETPILGSDTLDSNKVLDAAKGSGVKLYVSTFYQEGGSPDFDSGIKAWLNEDSTAMTNNGGDDTIAAVTAMGYDAYYVALEALKAAGSTDKAAVKAALPALTYTGVSGDIAFDATGDAIRDTAYIKTADNAAGAWTLETVQTVK
ncbi:MAG: ABC transporter substrate-binding protein [Oscillibacter sp.]|nr:ABC transporter substrate-binding protein [Oscillibacter sp.]MCI9001989.1 ABC transporter substrate-binding protein [Oscillibacter sp.]